ncbi:MAG: ABC transporter permease, partial [Pauljensenia sp.]
MSKKNTASLGVFTRIVGSQWFVSVISVVIAFLIGAILIAMTGASVTDAYYAMFRGAIVDPQASTFVRTIKPLMDSVYFAIPLIISGLGLAFGFRAGLFNIGGKGQMIAGALAAVWVGFSLSLPPVVHTLVALTAAIVAGAAWGGIAGLLKAKTGANEVIVTIMLNSIATLALGYVLSQKAWQKPNSNQPITPNVADSAALAKLMSGPIKLHWGLIVALVALAVFWFLMERSTLGFQIRAVGANAAAARTAGISVERITAVTMMFSGAFLGLAGANEALGTLGYVSR